MAKEQRLTPMGSDGTSEQGTKNIVGSAPSDHKPMGSGSKSIPDPSGYLKK